MPAAPATNHSALSLCLLLALCVLDPARLRADATVDARNRSLDERIAAQPQTQDLYLQRALLHSGNNRLEAALADIDRAESLGDPLAAALVHGIVLYRAARLDDALLYFDRFLGAYPRHPKALEYRARLLRDQGRYAAALEDYAVLFEAATALDPGHYLSAAKMLTSLDRPDEALALLDERMARVGVTSQLQRYAITVEIRREHYESAMRRLASLDQKLRATPEWQIEMAELHLLARRPEAALPYLALAEEQLRELRPTAARVQLGDQLSELRAQATVAVNAGSR